MSDSPSPIYGAPYIFADDIFMLAWEKAARRDPLLWLHYRLGKQARSMFLYSRKLA